LDCVIVLSRSVVGRAGFAVRMPPAQRVPVRDLTYDIETIPIRSAATLAEWLATPAARKAIA
jgi:hypothetical protein